MEHTGNNLSSLNSIQHAEFEIFFLFVISIIGLFAFLAYKLIKEEIEYGKKRKEAKKILQETTDFEFEEYIDIAIDGRCVDYFLRNPLINSMNLLISKNSDFLKVVEIRDGGIHFAQVIRPGEVLGYSTDQTVIEKTISETKSKGRIGRAVTGGILFGGAGAVVGGLTGKSVTEEKTVIDQVIVNFQVFVSSDKMKKFSFNANLIDEAKWKALLDSFLASEPPNIQGGSTSDGGKQIFISEELMRLKQLKDEGILSEVEFIEQKRKLLNQ